MFQERYDEDRMIYRDCKWCSGRGCLLCCIEAEKAYKRVFPDGPKPIATFTREQLESGELQVVLGSKAWEDAAVEAKRRATEQLENASVVISGLDISREEMVEALAGAFVPGIVCERIAEAAKRMNDT